MPDIEQMNFDEEVICDHLVTKEVKKLWYYEKSCLREFIRVCEKYNIKYTVGGGTLLGSIRHKGFIPWDDDIDVFMLWEEYKRFCEVAPAEIQYPFFFQHYKTQSGYGPAMARIRRNDTTGCTKFEWETADEKYNCGIFMDIFPLHGVGEDKKQLSRQKFWVEYYRKALVGYHRTLQAKKGMSKGLRYYFNPKVLHWRFLHMFMSHDVIAEKFLKACSMYNDSKKVGLISFLGFKDKYIWDKALFEEMTEAPFDELTVSVPVHYDEVLRHQFGDYMVYVKGSAIHTMAVFDPDTPYTVKLADRNKK